MEAAVGEGQGLQNTSQILRATNQLLNEQEDRDW